MEITSGDACGGFIHIIQKVKLKTGNYLINSVLYWWLFRLDICSISFHGSGCGMFLCS